MIATGSPTWSIGLFQISPNPGGAGLSTARKYGASTERAIQSGSGVQTILGPFTKDVGDNEFDLGMADPMIPGPSRMALRTHVGLVSNPPTLLNS